MNVGFWHSTCRALCEHARALLGDSSGAEAIEYGLIAALIAVAIIGSLQVLGGSVGSLPLGALSNALAAALS